MAKQSEPKTHRFMKNIDDPKNWLPLKEAAHSLRLSRHTVVRLCEERDPVTRKPYLVGWRPSPGTLLISRESLADFCRLTRQDLDFWTERKNRARQRSAGAPTRSNVR